MDHSIVSEELALHERVSERLASGDTRPSADEAPLVRELLQLREQLVNNPEPAASARTNTPIQYLGSLVDQVIMIFFLLGEYLQYVHGALTLNEQVVNWTACTANVPDEECW